MNNVEATIDENERAFRMSEAPRICDQKKNDGTFDQRDGSLDQSDQQDLKIPKIVKKRNSVEKLTVWS